MYLKQNYMKRLIRGLVKIYEENATMHRVRAGNVNIIEHRIEGKEHQR